MRSSSIVASSASSAIARHTVRLTRAALAAGAFALLLACLACGSGASGSEPPSTPTGQRSASLSTSTGETPDALRTKPEAKPRPPPRPPVDVAALFARLEPELVACFERGLVAAPKMSDGRVTVHATIGEDGAPTCVIPGDDSGLTQEVEDCMADRVGAARFGPGEEALVSLPIAVRGRRVALGSPRAEGFHFDSIATVRLPSAFELLEDLEDELEGCVSSAAPPGSSQSVVVGARVGGDGRAQCSITVGPSAIASTVRTCASGALATARFPTPKGADGLVLFPVHVRTARGR